MVTARWLDLFVEVERALCCVVVNRSGMVCIAAMYVMERARLRRASQQQCSVILFSNTRRGTVSDGQDRHSGSRPPTHASSTHTPAPTKASIHIKLPPQHPLPHLIRLPPLPLLPTRNLDWLRPRRRRRRRQNLIPALAPRPSMRSRRCSSSTSTSTRSAAEPRSRRRTPHRRPMHRARGPLAELLTPIQTPRITRTPTLCLRARRPPPIRGTPRKQRPAGATAKRHVSRERGSGHAPRVGRVVFDG